MSMLWLLHKRRETHSRNNCICILYYAAEMNEDIWSQLFNGNGSRGSVKDTLSSFVLWQLWWQGDENLSNIANKHFIYIMWSTIDLEDRPHGWICWECQSVNTTSILFRWLRRSQCWQTLCCGLRWELKEKVKVISSVLNLFVCVIQS